MTPQGHIAPAGHRFRACVIVSLAAGFAAAALFVFVGCGTETAPYPTTLEVPILAAGQDVSWTGSPEGERPVATVNGIPIPSGRLRRALEDAGEGADPAEILRALVAQEALAQEAAGAGFGKVSPNTFRRALVSRMIEDRFIEKFRPSDIPEEDLQKIFRVPAVFGRYNHLDIYSVQDYQWICCDATPASCEKPESVKCFEEGKAAMTAIQARLEELSPDSEDLPLLVEDFRSEAPRLTYQEYDFSFDPETGRQKGSRIFDDDVVASVVSISPGRFAGRLRSAFGWHLPFLKSRMPAVKKDLTDPEVRREVSEFFYPKFQQRAFLVALAKLIPVKEFKFLAPMYRHRKLEGRPAYVVELFPEDLAGLDRPDDELEGM